MADWQLIALIAGGAGLLVGILLARRSHQTSPVLSGFGRVVHYLAATAMGAVPFGVIAGLALGAFRDGVKVAIGGLAAAIVLVIVFAIPESVARRGAPKLKNGLFAVAWERWAALAKPIGDFNARVLLGLFYFTFILPFGLMVRLTSDRLRLRKPPQGESVWMSREPALDLTIDDARRQF